MMKNRTRMKRMLRIRTDKLIRLNPLYPCYLCSIIFFLFSFSVFADDFPPRPNTLVNDYTNTLSAEEQSRLESKLVDFNNATSTQIAIVIIATTNDYEI